MSFNAPCPRCRAPLFPGTPFCVLCGIHVAWVLTPPPQSNRTGLAGVIATVVIVAVLFLVFSFLYFSTVTLG